ncbi:hypothetical protein [Klebsiella pneumoniae]|uniref:hypothetical protein n=1 Tax=Klebsiella pneumoniae TaxID=573 RepID=UPI003159BBF7
MREILISESAWEEMTCLFAPSLDGAELKALSGIKFDHQAGTVLINGSQVQASILVTGGGQHATGKTIIQGDTTMTSQGTSIKMSGGAQIVMTGGARIIQN